MDPTPTEAPPGDPAIDVDAVPNLHDDLHALSASILADTERMQALELEKARLDPADPRAAAVAREVEQLTRNLAQKATAERLLTEEVRDSTA